MTFQHIDLSILLIVPIIVGIVDSIVSHHRRKKVLLLTTKQRLQFLTPTFSTKKYLLKKIFLYSSLIIFPIVLMEPTFGKQKTVVIEKNTDVVFLLDVSLSMLAEDAGASRLQRAKIEAQNIIAALDGERIALIAFAQVAAVILPLSSDYSAFTRMLNTLTPNALSRQGTNLASALQTAKKIFESGRKNNSKIIIVLSDGENHNASIASMGKILAKENIVVHTAGLGSTEGAPIPIVSPFTKEKNYLKSGGSTVVSKLNSESLKEIAALTSGKYNEVAKTPNYIETLINSIAKNQTITESVEEIKVVASKYKIPLIVILVLILIESMITNKKPEMKFGKLKNVLFIIPLFLPKMLHAEITLPNPFDSSAKKANQLYQESNFQKASEAYEIILQQEGESSALLHNLGLAKAQIENIEERQQAITHFNTTISQLKLSDPRHPLLETVYYNQGNTYLQLKSFSQASLAYINSLRINPNNEEARFNLELALKQSQSEKNDSQKEEQEENRNSKKNDSSENSKNEPNSKESDKTKDDFANKPTPQENNAEQSQSQQKNSSKENAKISKKRAEEIIEKIEENLSQQRKIGEHREFFYKQNSGNPW